MTCREWLVVNDYEDVAHVLDQILAIIVAKRKSTRRNWWEDLAGNRDGTPRVREGIEVPILRAAQIRQGVPVTANALCRNADELAPEMTRTNRWKPTRKRTALRADASDLTRRTTRRAS